jgi:hypothetical protein
VEELIVIKAKEKEHLILIKYLSPKLEAERLE